MWLHASSKLLDVVLTSIQRCMDVSNVVTALKQRRVLADVADVKIVSIFDDWNIDNTIRMKTTQFSTEQKSLFDSFLSNIQL